MQGQPAAQSESRGTGKDDAIGAVGTPADLLTTDTAIARLDCNDEKRL